MRRRGYALLVSIAEWMAVQPAHAQYPGGAGEPAKPTRAERNDEVSAEPKPDPATTEQAEKRTSMDPNRNPLRLPPHDSQHVSVTFSPLSLRFPVFECQAEVRIIPGLSVEAIFGKGKLTSDTTDANHAEYSFRALELGGQLIAYPVREFSHLHVGIEALWLHLSQATVDGQKLSATAAGTAIGPFGGYKLMTREGITLVAQGGLAYVVARAAASDENGASEHAQKSVVVPLFNLNAGWSF